MKEKTYVSNTALAAVLTLFLGGCRVANTLIPLGVLPKLGIPTMTLLSLAALLLEHYLPGTQKRCNLVTLALAALAFGLLPWAAGFAVPAEALKLALVGGVVFFAVSWLFDQIVERLSSGPAAKAAPVISAFGIYLAFQCFAGMLV